ncbi:MAG: hypothetical protein RR980_04100, partial [Mucinivorans sp.]
IIEQMQQAHIDTSKITVADSFDDFTHTLQPDDQIIVASLDCMTSLMDVLNTASHYPIYSLEEPWFAQPITNPDQANNMEYLGKLHALANKIHAARTRKGLSRAREQGKTLGRAKGQTVKIKFTQEQLYTIERLRRERGLSIAKACQEVGCSRASYYNLRRRIEK